MSLSMNDTRCSSVEMVNYKALAASQASETAYVKWYDSLNYTTDVAEKNRWALWVACTQGNPSPRLVTHILACSHTNLVNELFMRSSLLFCVFNNTHATWDAARRCAQILIRAGANIDAKGQDGSLTGSFLFDICLQTLNKRDALREGIKQEFYDETRHTQAVALLLAHGAKCTINEPHGVAQLDVMEFIQRASKSPNAVDLKEGTEVLLEKFNTISALAQQKEFQEYARETWYRA